MHICADEIAGLLVAVPALRLAYLWVKRRPMQTLRALAAFFFLSAAVARKSLA